MQTKTPESRKVKMCDLVLDARTQQRVKLSEDTVAEYAKLLSEKTILSPPKVFFVEGKLVVVDGFHTIESAKRNRFTEIEIIIAGEGTLRDAILFSLGVNAEHGLNRSNEDKRKAVEVMLDDSEWTLWSNQAIAKQCKVSEFLVRTMKDERASSIKSKIAEPTTKEVHRGGRTFKMNVANIGKSSVMTNEVTTNTEPVPQEKQERNQETAPPPINEDKTTAITVLETLDGISKLLIKIKDVTDEQFFEMNAPDLEKIQEYLREIRKQIRKIKDPVNQGHSMRVTGHGKQPLIKAPNVKVLNGSDVLI